MGKSIIAINEHDCFLCKRPASEMHHCIFGRFRKLSDKYGLVVPLCRECHEIVHRNNDTALMLKQIAQDAFDQKYGEGEFIKVFGVNFLD